MSTERRHAILRAIVERYVSSSEPVGSVALAAQKDLGVSSATIRNDMALLEEEGLIAQPHTSAGRIPTDKGYRYFVDHLVSAALREHHRRAISTFLADAVDVNDVVERSVRLLSQLTRQVAVVQYPSLSVSRVRRVEIVRLAADLALVVVVMADARVEQSRVAVPPNMADAELDEFSQRLNDVAFGLTAVQLGRELMEPEKIARLRGTGVTVGSSQPDGDMPAWQSNICAAVVAATKPEQENRVVFAGSGNLTRAGHDLDADDVGSLLDALEEQVVLLRLLHEVAQDGEVSVRIGSETNHELFSRTSIVAANYGGDQTGATVGALGPTRMDYPSTIAAVRAVARYLSKVVSNS